MCIFHLYSTLNYAGVVPGSVKLYYTVYCIYANKDDIHILSEK